VEQLRQVAVELKMAPVRSALHLPRDVLMAARAEGAGPEAFAPSAEALHTLLDDLTWWARALREARTP